MLTPGTAKRRRGLPKSKSGCMTCRIRRVKCGEERPACLRCRKFGVECDGYKPPAKASRPVVRDEHVLLPKQSPQLLPEPSTSLFSTEQDHRYFDIFCTKTAFEVLPAFDSGRLRQILLQACVSTPSIRHAVVALGALDVTAEIAGDFHALYLDDPNKKPHHHHQAALRQYNSAIKEMREASLRGKQDLRTTLLTCLVILCFEAWNGNQDLAVRQIQTGLQLIQVLREDTMLDRPRKQATGSQWKEPETEDEELIETFSKLDVQAISFAEESTPERHALIVDSERTLLENMPTAFQNVREADVYVSAILRRSMRFLARQITLPKPKPPKRAFPINAWWGVRDPELWAIQKTTLRYIASWAAAFEPLWKKLQSGNTSETTLVIAATQRLHIETAAIALIAVCTQTEEIFDAYTSTFEDILSLSSFILGVLNKKQTRSPKFSFDSYVVIPLHILIHKCRDKKIRRRALDMLIKNTRREGVWDSSLAARIGGWAMVVEEEFCDEDGKVPGWARIHGVVFERDQESRTALLTCEQSIGPDSNQVVERKKIIAL